MPEVNIRHEASIPYQHYQNAVERDVQTIVNGTATLLLAQSWLRKDNWDLAMFHYVDVRNKTPNVREISPYQIITKERVDLARDYPFAFGDFVCVHRPEDTGEWKFDLKNELGIYVGSPVE